MHRTIEDCLDYNRLQPTFLLETTTWRCLLETTDLALLQYGVIDMMLLLLLLLMIYGDDVPTRVPIDLSICLSITRVARPPGYCAPCT